jgi:hypothetical protein
MNEIVEIMARADVDYFWQEGGARFDNFEKPIAAGVRSRMETILKALATAGFEVQKPAKPAASTAQEHRESKSEDLSKKQKLTPWQLASLDDVASVDFELPIHGSNSADCNYLSDKYREAIETSSGRDGSFDTPEVRVFNMLWALTGMYFKSNEQNEPLGQ